MYNGNERWGVNMNKRNKTLISLLILIMIFSYGSYYLVMEGDTKIESLNIENGQVKLDDWDEEATIASLNGDWKYYDRLLTSEISETSDSKYINIPENKKILVTDNYYRYGTYTLVITGLKANHPYGIYSDAQISAYNLYANELLVLSNGNVSSNKEDHVSEWKPKSGTVYSDKAGTLNLAMEISNYEYSDGPFWGAIKLSSSDNIFSNHIIKLLIDYVLMLIFFLIAIILLGIYVFLKLDKSVLYFALFLADVGIRLLVTSSRPIMHVFGGISWNVMVRTEYATGYLLLPLFSLFVLSLIKFKYIEKIEKVLLTVSGLIVITVALTNHNVYTNWQIMNIYLWLALFVFIIFIGLVANYYRGDTIAKIIFTIVFINFISALVNQILGSAVSYMPVAMLNAVFGMGAIVIIGLLKVIRQNEILAISAMIDQLTGLHNRFYFNEFNQDGFDSIKSDNMYVMFADLDRFKFVNDTHGHMEGDSVLRKVCQRIRNAIRKDDILIRYGGDEFVLLVYAENNQEIFNIADRMITSINRRIIHEKKEHQIGISIGITKCSSKSHKTLADYVKTSDVAMYQAKSNGGNSYVML